MHFNAEALRSSLAQNWNCDEHGSGSISFEQIDLWGKEDIDYSYGISLMGNKKQKKD